MDVEKYEKREAEDVCQAATNAEIRVFFFFFLL